MASKKLFWKDTLYRNSFFLMASTGVMSFFGFFFWLLAARMYAADQIGIATTIISVVGLISSFSLLGFNQTLIRYLPKSEKPNDKLNTAFTLICLTSFLIALFYLSNISVFSPRLEFIQDSWILSFLFVAAAVITSLNLITDSAFIAFKSAHFNLIANTFFSVTKLLLLFVFVPFGAFGIYLAHATGIVAALVISLFGLLVYFSYRPYFLIDASILKLVARFSFGNYIAGFLSGVPAMALPVLITNHLGPKEAAYYYMAMMVANMLFIIPSATNQSMFAEGSHDETQINKFMKKSMRMVGLFMIPAIVFMLFAGRYILLAFGKNYSDEAFTFLQLLAVSGIPLAVSGMCSTILRIKRRIREIIFVTSVQVGSIIGLTYILLPLHLFGVGIAWFFGQVIACGLYVSLIYFRKFI